MDGDHRSSAKSDSGRAASSVLSPEAKEFIPSVVQESPYYASDASEAMIEVNGSIDALLNSPEMFFEIANDLSASLSKSLSEDDAQMASVVKVLFDVSVSEDNFRYSGARLLSFLCEHLLEDNGRKLRSQLLNICKDLFDRRGQLVIDSPALLIQFTLFMAELTCSLMINGCVIQRFPAHVLDLLCSLLVIASDESVKGFVQTLKLTGAILEKHESAKLEDLFAKVKQRIADDQSSVTQRTLLLSVVELKAASWLATGDSSSTEQDIQLASNSEPTDATAADYVQNLVEYFDDDDDDVDYTDRDFDIVYDGDIEYAVPHEMDPDMEDEYEKFIAENESQWLTGHKTSS